MSGGDFYRVDCGFFEHPAKALVVRAGIDKARSCETIENFVSMFVALKNLHPETNSVLEIETRPGIFKLKNPPENSSTGRSWFSSETLMHSKRNHLILGMNINVDLTTNSKDPYLKSQLEHIANLKKTIVSPIADSELRDNSHYLKFEPGVSQEFFFSRLNYFLKLAKQGSSKLRECPPAFTIDISKRDRAVPRQTIDLSNKSFYTTEKKYKSTLDVLHNGIQYRVAGAIEIETPLTRDYVKSNIMGAESMRIKVRRVFILFDTIEATFTRVFQINKDNSGGIMSLLKIVLDTEEKFDNERLQSDLLVKLAKWPESETVHEFEMEYLNTNELINSYKAYIENSGDPKLGYNPLFNKSYYNSKIRSLLFNSECLYSGFDFLNPRFDLRKDELHMRDYLKQFIAQGFAANELTYPQIGTYLDKMIYEHYLINSLSAKSQKAVGDLPIVTASIGPKEQPSSQMLIQKHQSELWRNS